MTANIGSSAEEAVFWLKKGEPVALPTETVYGLAAPLSKPEAIKKIYTLKKRPSNNPLIVHVLDLQQSQQVANVTPLVACLIRQFWPGPLTLILRKENCVPDCVTAGQSSVAVRSPAACLFREVIDLMGEPLVAPSANIFQHISPTTAQHVLQDMGHVLTYILDGGPCVFGVESTILSLLDERQPMLLRYGPITKEELETFLHRRITVNPHAAPESLHLSPGLYKKHYSPQTPLYLVKKLENYVPLSHLRLIFFHQAAHVFLYPPRRALKNNERVLSSHKNLREAAANLFAYLQVLDAQDWKSIWVEKAPNKGIGNAINDRLTRAAYMDLS